MKLGRPILYVNLRHLLPPSESLQFHHHPRNPRHLHSIPPSLLKDTISVSLQPWISPFPLPDFDPAYENQDDEEEDAADGEDECQVVVDVVGRGGI